jgi:enoyl-CoA hydratase
MAYENIRLDIDGALAILTIDRPKALNALNSKTIGELEAALDSLGAQGVRALIVTGGGEKAFVAGADITELRQMTPITGKATAELGQRVFLSIERCPKPVIAAINGFALGGGCELALACHIRIASEKAQLGLPEVTLGIIPGYGGTQRMARLLGKGKALELILTGDRIGAAEAEKIGLVNKVVPAEDLMTAAEELARKIASRGPLAVSAAIEAVMSGSEMPFEEGQFLEATLFGLLASTDDMREGMGAFVEKRTADFKGR